MFDPDFYGPVFGPLVSEPRLNDLAFGRPDGNAAVQIAALDTDAAFAPHRIADQRMADCCRAGIWLYYDHMDASHTISQSISTSTGSYWHAILHRREPDAWNSKYWWDRVGRHPIFAQLHEFAQAQAAQSKLSEAAFLAQQKEWNPHRFVDLCDAARGRGNELEQLCRRIQEEEWRLLFDYCFRSAVQA